MSQTFLGCKGNSSKKASTASKKGEHSLNQMALFSAIVDVFVAKVRKEVQASIDVFIEDMRKKISADADGSGDLFVGKIAKQIASDYSLDYSEIKARYCGKSSFEVPVPEAAPEVPVSKPEPVKAKKVKVPVDDPPSVVFSGPLMAFSKMKKGDLVSECERRNLDSEGTVSQLKERVKEARDADSPVAAAPKGKGKGKAKAAPKAKGKKDKSPPPPPPPPPQSDFVPLEEEVDDDDDNGESDLEKGDSLQARLRQMLGAEAEEESHVCDEDGACSKEIESELLEDEAAGDNLQERLRKILAGAGADDDDDDEYEEE